MSANPLLLPIAVTAGCGHNSALPSKFSALLYIMYAGLRQSAPLSSPDGR